MNQESSKAWGSSPSDEEPGDSTGVKYSVSVLSALVDPEVDNGGLDCIRELSPEDRDWIRAEAWRCLDAGPDAPELSLLVRLVVRRAAVTWDEQRLVDELARTDKPLSLDELRAELQRLRALMGKLSPSQWERLVGVAVLRWAAPKNEGRRACELIAAAVGVVRPTLDAAFTYIWTTKLLLSCSPLRSVDRGRLLWHLHEPTLDELVRAYRYHQHCVACESGATIREHRARYSRQQQIASDQWRDVCLELTACVPAGSEAARRLFDWADEHLEAPEKPTLIAADRPLLDRLVYANRPDARGRAALRALVEEVSRLLSAPLLVVRIDIMDREARIADRLRDEWTRSMNLQQRTLEESSPGFVDVRDTFLRSLAAAHPRPVKG